MATKNLGKVSVTLGGNYDPQASYDRLTIIYGTDGNTYITSTNGIVGIEPGVTTGWEEYYQLICEKSVPREVTITPALQDGTLTATITVDGTSYSIYCPLPDAALSQGSTNAIQNSPVATAISDLDGRMDVVEQNGVGVAVEGTVLMITSLSTSTQTEGET